MVSKITRAIGVKLKELVPTAKIYDERVKQNLKFPCFFIIRSRNRGSNALASYKNRSIDFDIVYMAEEATSDTDQKRVEELFLSLDVIQADGFKFRLYEKETFVQDQDLHLTCVVRLREHMIEDSELMQNAELRKELKDDESN